MAAHKSRTNVKIILAGTTLFLLVAASLLGFSSVMSAAAASLSIDDTNSTTAAEDNGSTAATISDDVSLNTTTTTTGTIQLAVEPFAIGQYAILSENMISQTETQLSFEGNTTIISPNTTETIMARDTGEVIFSLLPAHGSGIIRGQFHMTTEDGSESATADFTEFVRFESPTAIGIAYFSTNSTGGMLAPLNNMIAVFLDEEQPNQNAIVRFFEWKSEDGGAPIGSGNNSTPIATS
ncbi:MAG: hypothetical protein M3M91_04275 [Thermoproteota archaeon]|nr:hypothetical protein [Thermoproteota archaeon]